MPKFSQTKIWKEVSGYMKDLNKFSARRWRIWPADTPEIEDASIAEMSLLGKLIISFGGHTLTE